MKENNMQEIKPVYIHEANSSADDISLIDLAMVLVNRKKLIGLILICCIILGIGVALLIPKKYTYSTSIDIGSQIINGSIRSFETPQTLLAKVKHSFIPQTLNEHKLSNPTDEKKFEIIAKVPKNSTIIVLETKGTEEAANLLGSLLQSITQKVALDHNRIYNSVRQNIALRLQQATSELQILKKSNGNYTEITTQQNLIESYSSQLANLRKTHEISPPLKSIEPTGTSRKLIVIIAAFAGVFLGVFSAFFAEFIAKVREARK